MLGAGALSQYCYSYPIPAELAGTSCKSERDMHYTVTIDEKRFTRDRPQFKEINAVLGAP
jgi:hypothetical protein